MWFTNDWLRILLCQRTNLEEKQNKRNIASVHLRVWHDGRVLYVALSNNKHYISANLTSEWPLNQQSLISSDSIYSFLKTWIITQLLSALWSILGPTRSICWFYSWTQLIGSLQLFSPVFCSRQLFSEEKAWINPLHGTCPAPNSILTRC